MLNFENAITMVANLKEVEEQTKQADTVNFMETTFTEELTKEITSGSFDHALVELPSYIEWDRVKKILDENGYKDHYTLDGRYIEITFF